MSSKKKYPAESAAPTGTLQITLPDYNMFSPEEQEKAVKIMRLFWMALQANGLEERKAEKTGSLPTISAHFSGTLAQFSIEHYDHGYRVGKRPELLSLYADSYLEDSFLSKYRHIKKYLDDILEGVKNGQ